MDTPDGAALPGVGDLAPDFTAPNVHGAPVSLARLRGGPVLVVFVPFAFTPVCTAEAAALHRAWPGWRERDVQLLMISCDAVPTLRRWAEEQQVGFEVLSDFWPHGQVARAYGAFSELDGAADRVSVLIDADGVVRWRRSTGRGLARPVSDYQGAIEELLRGGSEGSLS
ncbi:redoxin domain-containing protein [Ruania zhangjianzhongii]|uniref:redoxin domain-containing protein n=1 Tax=Ruania zhangjianzhongii TaxID=2603206 RepID=UPI0011C84CB9|nr:redoxin domain-containing protein [Ruania zhangjianzhongii]